MTRFLLAAFMALALADSAAKAELMDVRPAWTMVCYPSNGLQYRVTTVESRRLVITSAHGVARTYRIIGQQRVGKGFAITASGWGRNLVAVFSATYGQLRSEKGFDHCSGDMAEVDTVPTPPASPPPVNIPEPALAPESGEAETY